MTSHDIRRPDEGLLSEIQRLEAENARLRARLTPDTLVSTAAVDAVEAVLRDMLSPVLQAQS